MHPELFFEKEVSQIQVPDKFEVIVNPVAGKDQSRKPPILGRWVAT